MTPSVLIIENEAMLSRALARALRRLPVLVHEATSHATARAVIEQHAESMAVVFMDRYLEHPSSDASDFLRWTIQAAPRARRVLMSGAERDKLNLEEALYHAFLHKPFSIAKFRAEVETGLAAL